MNVANNSPTLPVSISRMQALIVSSRTILFFYTAFASYFRGIKIRSEGVSLVI